MAAEDPSEYYGLERNAVETQRLNLQHDLARTIYDYLINPVILQSLPADALVADVGTGSGVWLVDAAAILPETTQFTGYDISSEQFPEGKEFKNITFEIADMKKPFPEHLHGKFDLVHARALNLVILPSEWLDVVTNIVRLVKPGGFLQWSEADLSVLRCFRGTAKHTTFHTLPGLFKKFEDGIGERAAAIKRERLQAIEQQALQNITYDVLSSDRDPTSREPVSRILIKTVLGWARRTGAMMAEEIEAAEEGADADLAKGAYSRVDMILVVGQKPAK